MQSQSTIRLLVLAALLSLIAWGLLQVSPPTPSAINSFDDCVEAGNPIMESYPMQCRTPDGHIYVQAIEKTPAAPAHPVQVSPACVVAGCSAQLCIEKAEADAGGGMSTCEYRAEYGCYKNATCERQQNGQCGWTQSDALTQCLKSPPQQDLQVSTEEMPQ